MYPGVALESMLAKRSGDFPRFSLPLLTEDEDAEMWWNQDLTTLLPNASDAERPLLVNISGIICVEDSPLGRRRKECGDSAKEHGVYCITRKKLAEQCFEDLGIFECSHLYPAHERQQSLSRTHTQKVLRKSADDIGFPQ